MMPCDSAGDGGVDYDKDDGSDIDNGAGNEHFIDDGGTNDEDKGVD